MALDWGTAQKNGSLVFTPCVRALQLRLESVEIQYEPSVYGGDGTELRRNIVFANISDEARQKVEALEAIVPNANSCIKEGALKCKISMDKVRIFDAARNRIDQPKSFKGWTVNAQVVVKGKWETKNMCGLCIEAQDIQFLQPNLEPECPF